MNIIYSLHDMLSDPTF